VIFAADSLALEAAFMLALLVRRLLSFWFVADIGPSQYLGVALGILLLPAINYQLGLYPAYMLGPVERLRRRTLATLAVFGALVAWDTIVARGVFSRAVLLTTFVFALVLPPLAETVARRILIQKDRWGIPVLMLGSGETGRAVARALRNEPQLGLKPMAFLDNSPGVWNTVVEGVPVIGPLGLACDFDQRAEAVIVALSDLQGEDVASLLQDLNFSRLIVMPDLAGVASLWVTHPAQSRIEVLDGPSHRAAAVSRQPARDRPGCLMDQALQQGSGILLPNARGHGRTPHPCAEAPHDASGWRSSSGRMARQQARRA
jgi:FlaA1/EpsC-like NDP-sugar epimerase